MKNLLQAYRRAMPLCGRDQLTENTCRRVSPKMNSQQLADSMWVVED